MSPRAIASTVLVMLLTAPALCGGDAAARVRGEVSVIPAVRERMRRFVEAGEIAGAVTLVAAPDRIIHLDATGWSDIAAGQRMLADTLCWIASMTKPITATAVVMLHDQGKLSIEDPVAKHLPEFARIRTRDGKPVEVTIRHLLTHTSGLGEITADEAREIKTLKELIALYVAKPVAFDPGTKWVYSQSGINTAARIVEVVSGESFVDYLDTHLFQPLGMSNTTFYLRSEQLSRLATSYRFTEDKKLEPAAKPFLYGKSATSRDRFPSAEGGLLSTAPDYARFCQMILNGGEFAGRRYLTKESVALMAAVQTGDLKTGFTEGNGWGLGWCVVRAPQGVTATLSPGSFGHGGFHGTQAWIDPERKLVYVLMFQRANILPNGDGSDFRRAFQEAVAESLRATK